MPVSFAVITVVTATVAIATRPKSFGVRRRPRTSVPSRYTTLLVPSCAPFHKSARPARFSSFPPVVVAVPVVPAPVVSLAGVVVAPAIGSCGAVAAALLSIPPCRDTSKKVNHVSPAGDLAQQIAPERTETPPLAAACQLIQQPDDERPVEAPDAAAEPAARGVGVLRIDLGHVRGVAPVQMSNGDFGDEADLVALDECAIRPFRVFAVAQQLRLVEGAGIVESGHGRGEIAAGEMIAFEWQ